ncbi:MAG: TIGR00341 family protein [Thermosynechococcaceae cyanobacterium]
MPEPTPAQKIFWRRWLRRFVRWRKQLSEFWNQNSGDWSWASEENRPLAAVNRDLWKASLPSLAFYTLLGLSSVISTLGLLAGSAATIIGAMIIAPLMGPIIGMAYSLVVGNRRLLKRSSLTLFKGILLCIVVSLVIALMIGLRTPSTEITARIRPTLIDLGVALAAGAAGAFGFSRRQVSTALPGVAIAVALVPPLSVIGIGIAWGSPRVGFGSSILFLTNLIGIIFSGCIVFLLEQYGTLERAKKSLVAGGVALLLLGLPLGWSLRNILIQDNAKRQVKNLISQRTLTFAKTEVERIEIFPISGELLIELDVIANPGTVTRQQVKLVQQFLTKELKSPVRLKVRVIPTEIFEESEAS